MAIMIKMMMNKKLLFSFLILDFIFVVFLIVTNNYIYLLNMQIAFVSSLLISFATFYSYKNNINKQIDLELEKQNNDSDYIDKIDDKYDLYSSDINETIIDHPTKEEIKEAMKPIKQNHIANLSKTILSFASAYRITAYIVLIIGFFYLNNNTYLHIYSYLFGFLIIPLSSLFLIKR
jgi:ABC-type transport system involved in cytochrome bd biosynthesis fused ATPase/permease subunit